MPLNCFDLDKIYFSNKLLSFFHHLPLLDRRGYARILFVFFLVVSHFESLSNVAQSMFVLHLRGLFLFIFGVGRPSLSRAGKFDLIYAHGRPLTLPLPRSLYAPHMFTVQNWGYDLIHYTQVRHVTVTDSWGVTPTDNSYVTVCYAGTWVDESYIARGSTVVERAFESCVYLR